MATQVNVKSPKMFALVLMIGGFMGLFSETALNMALTDIMADFKVSAATVQWLTTGYLLVMACLVPASSYLIKWFSTKTLIVSGILLSLLGVVIGALAPNFGLLLLGRLIQALGTGILLPIMVTVLMLIFPIEKLWASWDWLLQQDQHSAPHFQVSLFPHLVGTTSSGSVQCYI